MKIKLGMSNGIGVGKLGVRAGGGPSDTTRPTCVITCAQSSPTATSPLNMTFTFSESVTGFVVGDITVGNGSAGNFAGSGAVYTCDVTPTASGNVTVDVAEGVAQDGAGNTNTAAAQFPITYYAIVGNSAFEFDFSDISTLFQDTAAATPVTADGDLIGRANDKSGHGFNVTNTLTARPTYKVAIQNAQSIGRFDGGDRLAFAGSGLSVIRNISFAYIFVVAKCAQTAVQTDADILGFTSGGGNARLVIRANVTTANRITVGGRRLDANGFQSVISTVDHGGNFVVLSALFDFANSDLTLRQNGTQVAIKTDFQTDGNVQDTASTLAYLGSLGASFWNGDLAHIVCYTSAYRSVLSADEITQMENFLKTKWGINF